jgi:hypothetical protein
VLASKGSSVNEFFYGADSFLRGESEKRPRNARWLDVTLSEIQPQGKGMDC